ncbi:MAG: restriction endonuclease subunit M [Abitibacteriaceae bacterium]|nr:restriction endonuclease subunit M [Abditibacteriaceae bacterium]MBV9866250.1 restriction endonuclease subunit M [Abditibacteriaceae bacterium]
MSFLDMALNAGHAQIITEGKTEKIHYLAVNHKENWADPEEKVRAEYWAELIHRYEYDPRCIAVEFLVPDRQPFDRADLVVFHDVERKKPFAVLECKRDGISDKEFQQAIEQAFGNATWSKLRCDYMGVVAGNTRHFLDVTDKYPALERTDNIIADLPVRYGKPQEWRYFKGGQLDIHPVADYELSAALKKCHQTIWGGGEFTPPAAFGEMCKVIFVKIADEKLPRKKGDPYAMQIKTHESVDKLARRVHDLYDVHRDKDPEVFNDPIRIRDRKLQTVVSHLQSLNINDTRVDVKGLAFETFQRDFFTGDAGQYFTPRTIVQFAVTLLDPQAEQRVLDPACGSGGFLVHTLDHVRQQAGQFYDPDDIKERDHWRAHWRAHWHDFAEKRLFGIEISGDISRVAKMNMIVDDDGHTNVVRHDALELIERIANDSKNPGFKANSFDLILTNPPFGGQIKQAESDYLEHYELGNSVDSKGRKKVRNAQKTEILFLERIWQFLKPGTGRAAVVMPDGVLTNSSLQYVRDFLLDRFELQAVISLPQTAFAHFGAGVKSSLIVVRKRKDNEKPGDDEAIFMAAPEKIGYDATGRPCENQLPEVLEQFRAFQKNPQPFFV